MRRDVRALVEALRGIDRRGYKAYKEIQGRWSFQDFELSIEHVQGDPFADASRVRVSLSPEVAALPAELLQSAARRTGVASHLARSFGRRAKQRSKSRGTGKSGEIRIESPAQEVLLQNALLVGDDGSLEVRFRVGLPAAGRKVLAGEAIELLTEDVPAVAAGTLRATEYAPGELLEHATVNEDAEWLRDQLSGRGLVAFVADGSSLPRRSGIDDRPLEDGSAVPFRSPGTLRVTLDRPNAGPIDGMGVPGGVTLVVGGGYHGKSTLLRAIERGVYNHRPGDGREYVVTDRTAVKVRAEDGRAVAGVDISAFIDGLPQGQDTRAFSTSNASGSTSQAAAIVEAREAGAKVLLVDEDTAATNFMIRDRRMQALVPKEGEPITPFVDRVRQLHSDAGMSSILVLGGSGDYLDVADTVIAMRDYRPEDVTDRARTVAAELPTGRIAEIPDALPGLGARRPDPDSVDPSKGRRAVSIRVHAADRLTFGHQEVELAGVSQLVSRAQARAIGQALAYAKRGGIVDGDRSVPEILDALERVCRDRGLDAIDDLGAGELAEFRRFELAAALNRLRTLRVDTESSAPSRRG